MPKARVLTFVVQCTCMLTSIRSRRTDASTNVLNQWGEKIFCTTKVFLSRISENWRRHWKVIYSAGNSDSAGSHCYRHNLGEDASVLVHTHTSRSFHGCQSLRQGNFGHRRELSQPCLLESHGEKSYLPCYLLIASGHAALTFYGLFSFHERFNAKVRPSSNIGGSEQISSVES